MDGLRGSEEAGYSGGVADLAAVTLENETVESVLGLVVAVACATVPPAVGASAAVSTATGPDLVVASEEVRAVDLVQYSSGRGPCLEALRSSRRQNVVLDAARSRWPEFADAAVTAGYRSVLALPLRAVRQTVGSLALYARNDPGFGAAEVEAAGALARQAAITLANARSLARTRRANRDLQQGMATRGLIGQAQGILMSRHRCSGGEAFAILRRMSQDSNRRLREVAAGIVAEHERGLGPS